ncbi:polygalacturonase [Phytophthora sojae]|uniref:endo-polygalacturonase n=1 Tax=Phytophthora sojae (strain P6497) TaxID=1094619 RepID=G4ZMV8_PHYSP|nr:polygalacturonase [Phytophthora sojae]EGZ14681.1 polygalacturonase [Phytophthora sojae]|eukprot:XP_009528430.1 polygalacturonase [Phytophthora sojae]
MKLTAAIATFAFLAAIVNGSPMMRQAADGAKHGQQQQQQGQEQQVEGSQQQQQQKDEGSQQQQQQHTVTVGPLTVPAGVTLDLSGAKNGATIEFTGTTTFGTQKWNGPLVMLSGTELIVKGDGTLDGQGPWYWKQGQATTRPVFFQVHKVTHSTLSGFTVKDSPYRTGLTLDSKAGNGVATNTDGFDLSCNDHITITGNTIYNQDDCLAMQSSTNTIFSKNYCYNSHGISIGSLGGNTVDKTTTVQGLTAEGNHIIDSDNGLRIKTIIGLKGLVTDVKFIDNDLSNVKNGVVVRADYSKQQGGYTGAPTSQAQITGVTVSGLTGTATNLYDIKVNPNVVSDWTFSGIQVDASVKGTINGAPDSISA